MIVHFVLINLLHASTPLCDWSSGGNQCLIAPSQECSFFESIEEKFNSDNPVDAAYSSFFSAYCECTMESFEQGCVAKETSGSCRWSYADSRCFYFGSIERPDAVPQVILNSTEYEQMASDTEICTLGATTAVECRKITEAFRDPRMCEPVVGGKCETSVLTECALWQPLLDAQAITDTGFAKRCRCAEGRNTKGQCDLAPGCMWVESANVCDDPDQVAFPQLDNLADPTIVLTYQELAVTYLDRLEACFLRGLQSVSTCQAVRFTSDGWYDPGLSTPTSPPSSLTSTQSPGGTSREEASSTSTPSPSTSPSSTPSQGMRMEVGVAFVFALLINNIR